MKSDSSPRAIVALLVLAATGCSSDNSMQVEAVGGVATAGGGSGTIAGTTGTIVDGVGGANNTGGQVAAGGVTTANGGQTAPGGATGPGGANTVGGTTGNGGRSNQGGTKAAGGNTRAGGRSASGGTTGVGGSSGSGGVTSTGGSAIGGSSASTAAPCDIFKAGGTPCVAAHSTVRALLGSYSGKLYQVRRADNTTMDITTSTTGGFADGPTQETFCSGTTCVITVVYDQSGNGNDLWYQGSTVVPGSPQSSPAKADTESLTISGHKVYSLYIKPGNSYWRDGSKSGVPTGTAPEGLYMVTSGKHVNNQCCFDYGNSETTRKADNAGAMDAINFGKQCWFGGCSGSGPWVQADLEWGLFPGGSQTWNSNQKAFSSTYVTAMLKNNGTTEFALKGGDAQSGSLATLYQGALPPNGYDPMKKQGAIVLGSGGDCCKPEGGANLSEGTFYEGAVVSGYPTDATDDSIQSNIVATGYGAAAAVGF
jgi:non-reducing end alpha-L-arabinofuranosidase